MPMSERVNIHHPRMYDCSMYEYRARVKELSRLIVGRDMREAERSVVAEGFAFRVVSQDGIAFGGDARIRDDRVNVEVIDDVVVSARVG